MIRFAGSTTICKSTANFVYSSSVHIKNSSFLLFFFTKKAYSTLLFCPIRQISMHGQEPSGYLSVSIFDFCYKLMFIVYLSNHA